MATNTRSLSEKSVEDRGNGKWKCCKPNHLLLNSVGTVECIWACCDVPWLLVVCNWSCCDVAGLVM